MPRPRRPLKFDHRAMTSWVDKLTMAAAPRWTLKRQRARIAAELLQRHYEAASTGRRTEGWVRSGSDINAIVGQSLTRLRDSSRDTIRNNPYAESSMTAIADHAVGWGIVAKADRAWGTAAQRAAADLRWKAWANSTACDVEGRLDFYGIQKMVMRAVAEGGEVLVRRRLRRPDDGLPIPLQLQVIEPEFLDTTKDRMLNDVGRRQIQGVEFDAIGRRIAYWLFRDHPGADVGRATMASDRIPAEELVHVFKTLRPGQVRGIPWLATVMLRMKDFDDYEDATLMKQKIAACLAVITTDQDGSVPALGPETEPESTTDFLEPGIIANIAPGREVSVVQPPAANDHESYSKTVLRGIATGLGLTYEDLTGDYGEVNFSSARMARLRHWAHVEDWRWRMMVPQFCDPVWRWAMQAAAIIDPAVEVDTPAVWTAPPMPMIEPDKEGLAYNRNIRNGLMSWSEAVRERGFDPVDLLQELKDDFTALDKAGILLDIDVRNVTQGGQLQGKAAAAAEPKPAPTAAPAPARPVDDDAQATVADALSRAVVAMAEKEPAQINVRGGDVRVDSPINLPAPAKAPAVVQVIRRKDSDGSTELSVEPTESEPGT